MQNIKNIIIWTVAILGIIFSSYFIIDYKNKIDKDNQDYTKVKPVDLVEKAKDLPEYLSGLDYESKKDYENAKIQYRLAFEKTSDIKIKSVIDVALAGLTVKTDTIGGVKEYKNIYNNILYPSSTRAYSLLRVTQFYNGERNVKILENFYNSPEEYITKSSEDILFDMHTKIYKMQPFALSTIYLATYELSKSDKSTTSAKAINDKYFYLIDGNIEEIGKFSGTRHLQPNSFLSKANYMNLFKDYINFKNEDIEKAYEQAISSSVIEKSTITEEFSMLAYANFLSSHNKDKSIEILTLLFSKPLSKMIQTNLSGDVEKAKLRYSGVYKLSTENPAVKNMFEVFGWK